jgi:hypothetical protein
MSTIDQFMSLFFIAVFLGIILTQASAFNSIMGGAATSLTNLAKGLGGL